MACTFGLASASMQPCREAEAHRDSCPPSLDDTVMVPTMTRLKQATTTCALLHCNFVY